MMLLMLPPGIRASTALGGGLPFPFLLSSSSPLPEPIAGAIRQGLLLISHFEALLSFAIHLMP